MTGLEALQSVQIPHSLVNHITFQPGDVLVTSASATMWGYNSELERTMIVGQPSDEQRRMFEAQGPFLDLGDHTEIKPGMVFTVEPGLYAANLGGFRHSDTVVVTQDGIEILTYHPRDLDSLIIPA
jgi:Xaa-Pro dipeptidase